MTLWHRICVDVRQTMAKRVISRGRRRRLPAILAAVVSAFLAARPAAAQGARLTQITPLVGEIVGGSAAAPWRLRYGTFPTGPPRLVSADGRAYFSSGDMLRVIDEAAGVVTGRWRFPCSIGDLSPAERGINVRLDCARGQRTPDTITLAFDPGNPAVPNWPSDMRNSGVPQIEVVRLIGGGFLCSRRPPRRPVSADVRQAIEETARRDRFSPWMRLVVGKLLRDAADPRADDTLAGVADVPSPDFTEMLGVSACLETMGEPRLAGKVFDRAYGNYLARGFEPRMFISEFAKIVMYNPFYYAPNGRPGTVPSPELMERMYQLSPYFRESAVVWQVYAESLDAMGRADDARVWRARARDSQDNSLDLMTSGRRALDRVVLLASASMIAAVVLTTALFIKYLPQRRLTLAARARGRWMRSGFAVFNLEYWSRRERAAMFVMAFTLWWTVGFGNVYNQRVLRQMVGAPLSVEYGSLAGPAGLLYLRQSLPASPERDLLLAISRQQSGDTQEAERLYRSLPQFAESWNNLGVLLENAGRHDEARQSFQHALQIDPKLAEPSLNLGGRPDNYWTGLHQRYVPGRPMMAPPKRLEMTRAILETTPAGLLPRALAGPMVQFGRLDFVSRWWNYPIVLFDFMVISRETVDFFATMTVVAVWLFALVVLICPAREVSQAPDRVFTGLSWAVPGLSPVWGWAAGPVLVVLSYVILESVLIAIFGSPGFTTGDAAFWLRWYRLPTDHAAALAFGNPSWLVLGGSIGAFYAANSLLIWRANRSRASAGIV